MVKKVVVFVTSKLIVINKIINFTETTYNTFTYVTKVAEAAVAAKRSVNF